MAYSVSSQGYKYLLPFVGLSQPVTSYPTEDEAETFDTDISLNVSLSRVYGISERANSGNPR